MNQEAKIVGSIILVCVVIFAGAIALRNPQPEAKGVAVNDPSVLVRDNSWKIGAPDSKVTVVEFLDFECEACGVAYPSVKRILAEYEGKITFVVRNFPLHGNSVLAAKSAEAAGEQGKFWEMYAKLFENQREWGEQKTPQTALFQKYAQEIGLDMAAFNAVINSNKYEDKITRDKNDGIQAGVQGTPTFYVNGVMIRGVPSYNELKKSLDALLVTAPN